MKKITVEKLNIFPAFFSYAVFCVLLTVMQSTVFSHLKILGGKPWICLLAVCSVSVFSGINTGSVFSLCLGLCFDSVSGVGIALTPIYFIITSLIFSKIGEFVRYKKQFKAYLVFLPFTLILGCIFSYTDLLIVFSGNVNLPDALMCEILPSAMYSVLLSVPIYFISKLFDMPMAAFRENFGGKQV